MNNLIEEFITRYHAFDAAGKHTGQIFVTIDKAELPDALVWLRDFHHYTHLAFLTAVDLPESNTIQLTYLLHNYEDHSDLGIRVLLNRTQPVMTSIHHLWQQAKIYQRELREMFGIDFPGSPGLHENFALEGWEDIPPMRRDFDTKEYSEKTYFPRPGRQTHDPREYMKQKLYPDTKEES